jgi:hypothetical protein
VLDRNKEIKETDHPREPGDEPGVKPSCRGGCARCLARGVDGECYYRDEVLENSEDCEGKGIWSVVVGRLEWMDRNWFVWIVDDFDVDWRVRSRGRGGWRGRITVVLGRRCWCGSHNAGLIESDQMKERQVSRDWSFKVAYV